MKMKNDNEHMMMMMMMMMMMTMRMRMRMMMMRQSQASGFDSHKRVIALYAVPLTKKCVLILPSLLVKVAHARLLHFGRKDRAALLAGLEAFCQCFKAFKNSMPHNRPASTHANITLAY